MTKTVPGFLLSVCVFLSFSTTVKAEFEVDVPDEETSFTASVLCFGIYSKYYQMKLAYAAVAETRDGNVADANLGVLLARRGLYTWEKAILDRLGDQSQEIQQNYPITIQQASQALTTVFTDGGWDAVRESIESECDSYTSGEREKGLDPLDAGVTIPLLDSARNMTPEQLTQCLGVAEYDRVKMGPPGVMKSNAFRQRYADWIAEGGFSADEVSGRTEEFGRNTFESMFKKSVLASMEGKAEVPIDAAVSYCVTLLSN